jgi:hypothetical protein
MILLTILLALSPSAYASGLYLTGVYKPVSDGYSIQFEVHNELTGYAMYEFTIGTSSAWNVIGPVGWINNNASSSNIRWIATNQAAPGVSPGSSLGGFGFTTAILPTEFQWGTSISGIQYYGSVTPEPVPEPAALMTLAGGLGALALPILRRKRK